VKRGLASLATYAAATAIAIAFVYPFYWMLIASFRSQAEVLSAPLRLLPERMDLSGFADLNRISGVPFWNYASNSLVITTLATLLGVVITGLGAYALHRSPRLPLFPLVRYGFLLKIMYPGMLLMIPLYFVAYHLNLIGTMLGIVLVMSSVAIIFFLFIEFFRSIPREMIEAAQIDGASEWQILLKVVVPIGQPVFLTGLLISFLINWKQWFPIMVLSTGPETYTAQLALISLNAEYGVDFQAIMALAVLTVLPVAILFLLTQRWVLQGFMAGGLKG
jgi:ABC-type glycerol-3-phosphate transport system permease component